MSIPELLACIFLAVLILIFEIDRCITWLRINGFIRDEE